MIELNLKLNNKGIIFTFQSYFLFFIIGKEVEIKVSSNFLINLTLKESVEEYWFSIEC